MQKEVLMTESGLKKYEAELEELKSVRRKEISEKIKVALSFGDLSENSEYDEAKNEQAIVEARISELEELLKNVKIIDGDGQYPVGCEDFCNLHGAFPCNAEVEDVYKRQGGSSGNKSSRQQQPDHYAGR